LVGSRKPEKRSLAADIVLHDEAQRIAAIFAKLPELLQRKDDRG
jgi:hypothetical protein